jgi:hypothetical protein
VRARARSTETPTIVKARRAMGAASTGIELNYSTFRLSPASGACRSRVTR